MGLAYIKPRTLSKSSKPDWNDAHPSGRRSFVPAEEQGVALDGSLAASAAAAFMTSRIRSSS